jgi:hypothetical protein
MRKSTIVTLGILVATAVALTVLLNTYVGYAEAELRNGKELTDAFRETLAPSTRVKLRRVAGGERYPVKDPHRSGLIVEATPSAERWARDPSALGLARELSEQAFGRYRDDPISWTLLRMRRADGTVVTLAFEHGERGSLEEIRTGEAPKKGP